MKTWIYGLIIISSLFCGGAAHCQPPQKINSNYQFKSAGADQGGLRPPKYQTLPATPDPNYVDSGAIAYQASDSSLYQWSPESQQWRKISNGQSAFVDSTQNFLGAIYQAAHFTNTTPFVATGVTLTAAGGSIDISPGAPTFGTRMDTKDTTILEGWKAVAQLHVTTIDANSFGGGWGIHSINTATAQHLYGVVDLSTGGTGGKALIYTGIGTSFTRQVIGTGTLTFNANDSIYITTELDVDSCRVTAYDINTNTVSKASFGFTNSYPANAFLPNTGTFSFVTLSDQHIFIDSISLTSKQLKNATVMAGGDSKARCYYAGSFQTRMYYLFGQQVPSTVIHAGSGDRSTEMLATMPEVITLKPKQYILNAPSNDVRFGVPTATSDSNVVRIYNTLTNAGIKVVLGLPMYETSQDLSGQLAFMYSRFPTVPKIDYWSPMKRNPAFLLAPDGIHPNLFGNDTLFKVTLNSFAIRGGANTTSLPNINGTPPHVAKFLNTNSVGNSAATDDGTTYTIPENTYAGPSTTMPTIGANTFPFAIRAAQNMNFAFYSFANQMNILPINDTLNNTDSLSINGRVLYLGTAVWSGNGTACCPNVHKVMKIDTSGNITINLGGGNGNFGSGPSTSKLTVVSTTQGTIPWPIMTTTQKLAIVSPAEGLAVYDSTLHQPQYWNGTTWTPL